MHPIFNNQEIVEEICEFVRTASDWQDATMQRRTLLSLAMTCSSAKDPAIRALWHTITGLGPILNLLGIQLLAEEASKRNSFQFSVDCDQVEQCMKTFDTLTKKKHGTLYEYSSLVKVLDPVSILLPGKLLPFFTARPLFPKLQRLGWACVPDCLQDQKVKQNQFLAALLSPSIVHMELTGDIDNNISAMLARLLRKMCPKLNFLKIMNSWTTLRAPTLPNLGLARLETLDAMIAHRSPCWNAISTLPSLRHLVLRVQHIGWAGTSACTNLEIPKKTLYLRTFTLYAKSARVLERLMDGAPRVIVPTIKLYVVQLENPKADETRKTKSTIRLVVETLMRSFHMKSLKDFTFAQCARFAPPFDIGRLQLDPPITLESIRDFLDISGLHSFKINFRCDVDLDNDALDRIGRAWPYLKHLSLFEDGFWPAGRSNNMICSRITPKGLLTLARHCRHLENLSLALNAHKTCEYPSVSDEDVQTALTTLAPGCVPLSSQRKVCYVAEFLKNLFPNLQHVDAWPETSQWEGCNADLKQLHRFRWEKVEVLLNAFPSDNDSDETQRREI